MSTPTPAGAQPYKTAARARRAADEELGEPAMRLLARLVVAVAVALRDAHRHSARRLVPGRVGGLDVYRVDPGAT